MKPLRTSVAIIGAGPYGLSIAAYLRARGLDYRIFGPPMGFWLDMPEGMALKSEAFETDICTPAAGFGFVEYRRKRGLASEQPIDAGDFNEYALWAQQALVPDVEDVRVTRLGATSDGFALELSDGERVEAGKVVVATGLSGFERIPEVLRRLPADFIGHTSAQTQREAAQRRDVTIIGGGQSALEAAAFLHGRGVTARVLVRGEGVHFSDRSRSLYQRIRHPGTLNFLLKQAPMFPHYLPANQRLKLVGKRFPPGGTWWVRDALGDSFKAMTRTTVRLAEHDGESVRLTVDTNGAERTIETDYVIAGTGYEVDVDRISYLDPSLAAAVDRTRKAPKLSNTSESSVPGLYFTGPIAANSFGPMLRFVAGASFMAPRIAGALARRRR